MEALLVNPTYPQTFWSFDRTLRMLGKKAVQPPLGLLTVAALLPKDWQLRLVDMMVRDLNEDDWATCDVVLITGLVTQWSGMKQVIAEAKRRGKVVVVGGPLVFHIPDEALKAGADIVVKGEAELLIPRLLEALKQGESGLLIAAAEKPDLSTCPPPRYDLIDTDNYAEMAVQFSRGCPFQCEFCDITLMLGHQVRTKGPAQVLQELQTLYDLGWRRQVFFVDDNFVGNPSKAKALLKELIPWMTTRSTPFDFSTQASVNLSKYTELLDLMVRAGFVKVFLGIETPDQESLELTKKFQNSAIDLDLACETISRSGLQIQAGCIIGFDNERAGADQRLIDFAVRNDIPEMFVTLLHAAPGTGLWERLASEDRLLFEGFDDNFGNQTGILNFIPTRANQQIIGEFIRLYEVLYKPENYMSRCFRQFAKMPRYETRKRFELPDMSEVRAVVITVFRQGLLCPARAKFWKYMISAIVRFPTRLRHYVAACVIAEHYYEYRKTIRQQLLQRLDAINKLPPSIADVRGES